MKTPFDDLMEKTMEEHERRIRIRERDILDCLCEREREVWILMAIGGLEDFEVVNRINAREGAGTVTKYGVRVHYRVAQRKLQRMLLEKEA